MNQNVTVSLPKLCFIGSGNLATQLALAFAKKNYPILQVYSRTKKSASILAEKVQCSYITDITLLSENADVYICALKDSALEEVLSTTAFRNKLVLHTAGSVPMKVLSRYSSNYGVLYPLQTLSKNKIVNFSNIPLFIEANTEENYSFIESLAGHISGSVYRATSEQRKKLHLAAVFACNFANHMYVIAEKLLNETGLPFDVLLPLIDETAEKVHFLSPKSAQTGPAIRYDENVINRHLDMLKSDICVREIYELLSKHIHENAEQ